MVSVLALTMEVSKGLMVTLSFSFTVSSNDLISRGQVVMSVQTWFTLAQKAHCIVLVLTVAHATDSLVISLSIMMFKTLSVVRVPKIIGTLDANSELSSITRHT